MDSGILTRLPQAGIATITDESSNVGIGLVEILWNAYFLVVSRIRNSSLLYFYFINVSGCSLNLLLCVVWAVTSHIAGAMLEAWT
jgi:hypothetical protein